MQYGCKGAPDGQKFGLKWSRPVVARQLSDAPSLSSRGRLKEVILNAVQEPRDLHFIIIFTMIEDREKVRGSEKKENLRFTHTSSENLVEERVNIHLRADGRLAISHASHSFPFCATFYPCRAVLMTNYQATARLSITAERAIDWHRVLFHRDSSQEIIPSTPIRVQL